MLCVVVLLVRVRVSVLVNGIGVFGNAWIRLDSFGFVWIRFDSFGAVSNSYGLVSITRQETGISLGLVVDMQPIHTATT